MKQETMLVLRCVVIAVAVVGIMGDELTLSDVIVKMTQMERKNQNHERQIEVQPSTSFFSVQIAQDTEVLNEDTVQFDLVKVNYGDDYIASGGIYIAPEDGYYMFTPVIREVDDSQCAGIVMHTPVADPGNPVELCRAEAADSGHNTGTCTVVTELFAGDQVSMIADGIEADTENSRFAGEGYTSLTGLLIRSGLE